MGYLENVKHDLSKSSSLADEIFFQAVFEVLDSLEPILQSDKIYEELGILERLVVPDREFKFKVVWFDDNNRVMVNTGYRVQFNNALGPYKGGLRFHPSVNSGILKFLGFEQIFKNSLTGLMMGGAKGGSDFNPKGKSNSEVMKFCKAYMTELHKHIGPRVDIPAGDIGVGAREIGFLFGEYKKITSRYEGIITGKPYMFGGSLLRPEATGYGVVYFADELLRFENKEPFKDKICCVSGSGNVAIYTIEKLQSFGATVVSCSDSKGTIYDSRGLDVNLLKELKFHKRTSLEEYVVTHTSAIYTKVEDYPSGAHEVWTIPCYAAFPCATQNELNINDAKNLIENGCQIVVEGANMPSSPDAIELFLQEKNYICPCKSCKCWRCCCK